MANASAALNLVVNCTARKRIADAKTVMNLREITAKSVPERAKRWIAALDSSKNPQSRALDLYSGDSWSVVRECKGGTLCDFPVDLSIASAGYGLVSSTAQLAPYSATFASGFEDSVAQGRDHGASTRTWWKALCDWRDLKQQSPKSLQHLASKFPDRPLLLALSAEYVEALKDDLLAARDSLADSDLMIVVSVGAQKSGELSKNFLPCHAGLEHTLGGARCSLNARIARCIIEKYSIETIRISHLRPSFKRLLKKQPGPRVFHRHKMSDVEIIDFISHALSDIPEAASSSLLRKLRDSGYACEQRRFRDLFQALKTAILKRP